MEKISRYQVVDLEKKEALEAELRQLTTIRNNMPREAWGHIEQKMAEIREQIKKDINESKLVTLTAIKTREKNERENDLR